MWVDTHTHLNFKAFENDWREVVERSVKAGLRAMIVVGTDIESSKRAVEMAEESEYLWASVGIHPHHAKGIKSINSVKGVKKLAKHPRVVAIGEVGLDYHVYENSRYKTQDINKELQRELLGAQIEIAGELDKPLIIHSREAGEEVLESISEACSYGVKAVRHKSVNGVFHCFEGSKKYLRKVLQAGFYVSFTGQITYVKDRAEVAKEVPLERLLVETDCPYMKPFREKLRCEPADVTIIGQFQADQRKVQLTEVEKITTANAERLFGL